MNWESFYLVCFFVGLILALVTFLSGAHAHFHFHLPIHVHFAHGFHVTTDHGSGIGPINGMTILVFLTCFGAAGVLLTHYDNPAAVIVLGTSMIAALIITSVFYLAIMRTLAAQEHPLRSEDFDMTGVLGHLSIPIRVGGTGELVYEQAGTRRSCGARSESGVEVAKGTEVVVMRYENGIAYVRPWTDLDQEG